MPEATTPYTLMLMMDRVYRTRFGRLAVAIALVLGSYQAGRMMNGPGVESKDPRYVGGTTIIVVDPRATQAPPSQNFTIDAAPVGGVRTQPVDVPASIVKL